MLSHSYDKMKFANEREDKSLRRRLKQIAKGHTDQLQVLHKEKCQVVAELRAYRVRELRNIVRESLRMEQKIQKQRIKFAEMQMKMNESKWRQNKPDDRGFSKIDVTEKRQLPFDERIRRNRTVPDISVPRGSITQNELSPGGMQRSRSTVTKIPSFMVLYYPNVSSSEWEALPTRHKGYGNTLPKIHSSLKVVDPIGGKTSLEQIPKRSMPSYVEELAKLQNKHFDQFTDGTMALEMRRFQQIQRERMPPLVGHLPVRLRYTNNFDAKRHLQEIRENLLSTESEEAVSALNQTRALGVLDPKKARHYVPRSKQGEEATNQQIMKENQKLNKLKKANQAEQYRETLSRVDTFLGVSTKGKELVHQENLSREEVLMLKTLSMDPGFGTIGGSTPTGNGSSHRQSANNAHSKS